MLAKTAGIVIGTTKYKESSIISRIFTERFGFQSYIINGVRSAKGKFKIGLFQPMTILDLVVYHKENGGIQRLSEAKCLYPYNSVSGNIVKSTLLIFINEILNKTLREGSNPEEVFSFLVESLIKLDSASEGLLNFHLGFLLEFASYLGFAPHSFHDFEDHLPKKKYANSARSLSLIKELIENPKKTEIETDNESRRVALELILQYYNSHIETLTDVKSKDILREILS